MVWRGDAGPCFADRAEAGRRLPRGGVAVAAEIANKLWAPLDLLLVRKDLKISQDLRCGRGC